MYDRHYSIKLPLNALLCCVLAAFMLPLERPILAQEKAKAKPASKQNTAQLESLLNRAYARTVEYTNVFKDLMAEERQTVELYNATGQLVGYRRIVSDLVVYQSQLNNMMMVEYRNVREVDGVTVSDQQERAMSLAQRLMKVDSVSKELDRVDREASRYELSYSIKGYTLNQGMALQKEVREAFEFEEAGREMIDGQETIILNYQQVAKHPQIKFNLSLPKVKSSEARYRGRLWLDARTAQIRREEREIAVPLSLFKEPVALMQFEFYYRPSQFKILTPRLITFTTLGSIRKVEGQPPIRSPGGRVKLEYGAFEMFGVTVKPNTDFTPQRSQ